MAVFAGAGLMLCLFFLVEKGNESTKDPDAVAQADTRPEEVGRKPEIVRNNYTTMFSIKDKRKVRENTFKMEKNLMKAEGIELKSPGEMTFTSQVTGTELTQKIISASLHKQEGGSRTVARGENPPVDTTKRNNKSHLRYFGFFDGIDLEYTYDGKDVEEFFHISDKLRNTIVKERSDLKIKAEFPGVTVEDGAILSSMEGTPLELDFDPLSQEIIPAEEKDSIVTRDAVELGLRGDRFVLPAAVVSDAAGRKTELERHFSWQKQGLVAELILPFEWMKEAKSPIVIDPSIIDNTASANSNSWQETSLIRDSLPLPTEAEPDNQGRFHYVWRAYYNSKWTAMYANGTGHDWSTPIPMDTIDNDESQHYTPSLTIDSTDTLHAIWSDYGVSNESNKDLRGDHPSSRHRLHYAYCPNRCQSQNWNYNGGSSVIIAPSSLGHQMHASIAVDSSDVIHIAFEQRDPYQTRYFQVSDAGAGNKYITEKMQPGQTHHASFLVVDGEDTLHYLGAAMWGPRQVLHYKWNAAAGGGEGGWDALARTQIYKEDIGCTTKEPLTKGHAVAKGEFIHLVGQARLRYCGEGQDTYAVWYGRYDLNQDAWEGVCPIGYASGDPADRPCLIRKPVSYDPKKHDTDPMITIDEAETVHVVWRHEADPQKQIIYSSLLKAGDETVVMGTYRFSSPVVFLNTPGSYQKAQLRPRLEVPGDGLTGSNNVVQTNLLDLVAIENGVEIRYISTAEPLEGAQPTTPPDHTYTSDPTPTFSWSRLASDDGTNTKYTIQVSTTPLFTVPEIVVEFTQANYGDFPTYGSGVTLENDKYYYWRVSATNASGTGPFGPIYELGIDTEPPGAFTLVAPINGTDPETKTPTFEWNPALD